MKNERRKATWNHSSKAMKRKNVEMIWMMNVNALTIIKNNKDSENRFVTISRNQDFFLILYRGMPNTTAPNLSDQDRYQ